MFFYDKLPTYEYFYFKKDYFNLVVFYYFCFSYAYAGIY